MNEEVSPTTIQKAQAILWLSELKSVENVNQRWLDTYKCDLPSENTLKEWMENFTKFGNVEGDHQELPSPRKKEKRSNDSSFNLNTKTNPQLQIDSCTKQQNEDLSLQQSKSFGNTFSFNDKTTTLENIRKLQEDFCNERDWNQYHSPRNILLALVGEVGELAEIFQWKGEVKKGIPSFTDAEKEHVGEELSDVLIYLIRLADRCEIDLPSAALQKFEKNAKKYPANRVYGKSKKYKMNEEVSPTTIQKAQAILWLSELKSVENVNQRWLDTYKCDLPSENTLKEWMENFTKFGNVEGDHQELPSPRKKEKRSNDSSFNLNTKTNLQLQIDSCTKQQNEDLSLQQSKSFGDIFSFNDKTTTLENIRKIQEEFCNERGWNQNQTPRNILLALVGEVGELAEIFQWKGEVKKGIPSFTDAEKEHVGEELSDVLIYLIRLADRCEIDLPSAALQKFEKNAKKYPANRVYGKSKKYSEYQE